MAINIEKTDLAFNSQLKALSSKIGKYGTTLGLTAAEVTALQADATAFDYIMNNQAVVQDFAQTFTYYKNMLRKGGVPSLGPVPIAPVPGSAPPMPAPNLEGRLRSAVQRMAKHPAYTPAMGEDMGIEAPLEIFSAISGKPAFFIEFSSGGYPNLRWTKGKYQGVEIWKDSGQGFVKLDRDMKPDYIDKSTLPALGQSATWKYKMIYLINDEVTGNWSDVVSVTVHGEI